MRRRLRHAGAGALAACAWGAFEPIDRRVLRYDYSDIAVLGKLVTRGRGWPVAGFALHAANGAVFGVAFDTARRRFPISAVQAALLEHVALYPLAYFIDRYHPARGEEGVPPLLLSPRAFAQATVRHTLFGAVLGALTTSSRRSA